MAAGEIIRGLNAPASSAGSLSDGNLNLSETGRVLSDNQKILSEDGTILSDRDVGGALEVPKMEKWAAKACSKQAVLHKNAVFPVILTCSLGGIAVATIFAELEPIIQITAFVAMIIALLMTNPFRMVERTLAFPSRCIVSADLFILDIGLNYRTKNVWYSLGALSLLLLLLVITQNEAWLLNEWTLNTESTYRAKQKKTNDLAEICWNAYGKREVGTAIEQDGMSVSSNFLNFTAKKIFRVGFFDGMQFVKDRNKAVDALQETIEQQQKAIAARDKLITEHKKDFQEIADTKARLSQSEGRNAESLLELGELRKKLSKLEAENQKLTEANEEMAEGLQQVQQANEDLAAEGLTEEKRELLCADMIRAGIPYRKIEPVIGYNRDKISKIKQKYGIETKGRQDE